MGGGAGGVVEVDNREGFPGSEGSPAPGYSADQVGAWCYYMQHEYQKKKKLQLYRK